MVKNIFVTYKTDEYPEDLLPCKKITESNNPTWTVSYFGNKACEEFIEKEYPEFLESFRIIKPGAYKADLFRCLIVHKHGGVYSDIKLKILFDLDTYIEGKDDENDTKIFINGEGKKREFLAFKDVMSSGIWNGFFYADAGLPLLYNIAKKIDENVKLRLIPQKSLYYYSELLFSGPQLWGIEWKKFRGLYDGKSRKLDDYSPFLYNFEHHDLPLKAVWDSDKPLFFWRTNILVKNKIGETIIECDKNFTSHVNFNQKTHYSTLFKKKDVFNDTLKRDVTSYFALEQRPNITDAAKIYLRQETISDVINGYQKEALLGICVIVGIILLFVFISYFG